MKEFRDKRTTFLFRDVDDVDLFVGLNLEDSVKGGLVGPITSFFVVEQFKRLRDGDRFFYTHTDALTPGRTPINSFTLILFSFIQHNENSSTISHYTVSSASQFKSKKSQKIHS